MSTERLSRELSPEEVAEEMRGVDESLPESMPVHRRPLTSSRARGAAEHRDGTEEEPEEDRALGERRESEPDDPPRDFERPEGAA